MLSMTAAGLSPHWTGPDKKASRRPCLMFANEAPSRGVTESVGENLDAVVSETGAL